MSSLYGSKIKHEDGVVSLWFAGYNNAFSTWLSPKEASKLVNLLLREVDKAEAYRKKYPEEF